MSNLPDQMQNPILYTFRRCPYAMRARMGLAYAKIQCEVREILLRNKPASMLAYSPKGTVPILVLSSGTPEEIIIEESLEVMTWALEQNDLDGWQEGEDKKRLSEKLIAKNDGSFKKALDQYKYFDRFPEHSQEYYRKQGEEFFQELEALFEKSKFLCGDFLSFADVAIFPFIRQFSRVELTWFESSPYPKLQSWLQYHLDSELFLSVMKKYKPWQEENPSVYFLE